MIRSVLVSLALAAVLMAAFVAIANAGDLATAPAATPTEIGAAIPAANDAGGDVAAVPAASPGPIVAVVGDGWG